MSPTTYTLHPYDHRFDAGLAEMWNESDDQWPGTFNNGVPMTQARVSEWMDRIEAMLRFVVSEDETGKVVAYGDLWEERARPQGLYVSLLNVHPEHQGRSLARRMLTEMVNWASENGYLRVTIGTWPANLKAMPLYKKTGFFWKPGTSVYMENYIPAVRQLAPLKEFFEQHDWYRTFDRALDTVEDEMRDPGTGDAPVYVYRFQADDRSLQAVFDRQAHALSGLETERYAVFLRVEESKPAQGLAYAFHWDLVNKKDAPLPMRIQTGADLGICITLDGGSDVLAPIELGPGERQVISASYRIETGAPGYNLKSHDVPSPALRSVLTIDGQELELACGLRYRPPVEFSIQPEVFTLLPGQSGSAHLQIQNQVKRQLSGHIALHLPEGLQADWDSAPFRAGPLGHAGIPLELKAQKTGLYPMQASVTFEDSAETITSKPKPLPVVALETGHTASGEGDDSLILENDFFRITCHKNSGAARVWSKTTRIHEITLLEELGPPYLPLDLYEQRYELALRQEEQAAIALLTVRSTRFPGLLVGREIRVTASPLIQVENWVTNHSETKTSGLNVQTIARFMRSTERRLAFPLPEGIILEPGGSLGQADGDLPEDPAEFAQNWIAYQQTGQVAGLIWPQQGVEKIELRWGGCYLTQHVDDLEPGQTAKIGASHLYLGPGDWHAVQQVWRGRSGSAAGIPEKLPAKSRSYFDMNLEPPALITHQEQVSVELQASNTREYQLSGQIRLELPSQWSAEPDQIAVTDLNKENPLAAPIRLRALTDRAGAWRGRLRANLQAFDRSKTVTLLRLGRQEAEVSLAEERAQGQPIWELNNETTQWQIAPQFSGAVVGWRETGQQVNHLLSGFPEVGAFSWLKPWYGGIRPTVYDPVADQGWPGKLHRETFQAASVRAADANGLQWQGLRLSGDLTHDPYQGLQFEIDYLTVGGSNVLKLVQRIMNPTAVYHRMEAGFLVFLQVDGDHRKAVLHTESQHRKRVAGRAWINETEWAAVENADTGRAIVMVQASGWQRQQAMDWVENGAHFNSYQDLRVPPHGSAETVAYLALADSLDQARNYRALAGLHP